MTLERIFSEWFGVDGAAARLLVELYNAKGRAVPHDYLTFKLGITIGSIRASMHDLKQAMEPQAYAALYGHGYRLTEVGITECKQAMSDARSRGVAA